MYCLSLKKSLEDKKDNIWVIPWIKNIFSLLAYILNSAKKSGKILIKDSTPCNDISKEEWEYCSIAILRQCLASTKDVALTIGLPVFAQFSGGIGIILGPTGGFILSFPIIAFVVGYFSEKFKSTIGIMFGMICSLLISYIIGTLQFCIVTNSDFIKGLTICVAPFIIVDIIKLSLATLVGKSILRRVNFGYSIETS